MISNLVGTRIRAIRARRKLTQQQLADVAGIPRATLATVERDGSNPSLAVAYQIATALGLTIDDLLEESRRRVQHIPASRMRSLENESGSYRSVTISPANAFHLMQQIFVLQPGATFEGRPHPPGSEEYLHILEGVVQLDVAGETLRLSKGDSARFGGNVTHFYRNPRETVARGLVTILEGAALAESER